MRASVVAMTTITEICIPLNKIYFPITTVIFVVVVVVVVVFFLTVLYPFRFSWVDFVCSLFRFDIFVFLVRVRVLCSFRFVTPLIYLGC